MKNGKPSLLSMPLSINSFPNFKAVKFLILSSNNCTSGGLSGPVSVAKFGDFSSVNCTGSSACLDSSFFGGVVLSGFLIGMFIYYIYNLYKRRALK